MRCWRMPRLANLSRIGCAGRWVSSGRSEARREREAAAAVGAELQRAVAILRVGDFMQAIRAELALQALCKPQQ